MGRFGANRCERAKKRHRREPVNAVQEYEGGLKEIVFIKIYCITVMFCLIVMTHLKKTIEFHRHMAHPTSIQKFFYKGMNKRAFPRNENFLRRNSIQANTWRYLSVCVRRKTQFNSLPPGDE